MIFNFETENVNFFEEDKNYFEQKILRLKKFFGSDAGDRDTIDTKVRLLKNKHRAGEKFECAVTIFSPRHGKFVAEISAENIRKCADEIYEKLKKQIKNFHEKGHQQSMF